MQFTVSPAFLVPSALYFVPLWSHHCRPDKRVSAPHPSSLLHPSPWQQPPEFSSISLSLPWLSLDSPIPLCRAGLGP